MLEDVLADPLLGPPLARRLYEAILARRPSPPSSALASSASSAPASYCEEEEEDDSPPSSPPSSSGKAAAASTAPASTPAGSSPAPAAAPPAAASSSASASEEPAPIAGVFGRAPPAPAPPGTPPSPVDRPVLEPFDLSGFVRRWVNLLTAQRSPEGYQECYTVCNMVLAEPGLVDRKTGTILHYTRKTSRIVLDPNSKDWMMTKIRNLNALHAEGKTGLPASYSTLVYAASVLRDPEVLKELEACLRGTTRVGRGPIWIEANVAHMWLAAGQDARAFVHVSAAEALWDGSQKTEGERGFMSWMYETLASVLVQDAPESRPGAPTPGANQRLSAAAQGAADMIRRADHHHIPVRGAVRTRVERCTGRTFEGPRGVAKAPFFDRER
eukprot:tig00020801_g13960.t1